MFFAKFVLIFCPWARHVSRGWTNGTDTLPPNKKA